MELPPLRRTWTMPVQTRRSRKRGMARFASSLPSPAPSSMNSVKGRPIICGKAAPTRSAKLRNFLGTLPCVQPEEDNQHNEADRESLEAMGERPYGFPGNHGEHNGKNEQQEKSEAPQFALAPFELLETVGNSHSAGGG